MLERSFKNPRTILVRMPRSDATDSDRTVAVITHVLGYFFSFLGPLIVLLASDREWVRKNARRALDWQISLILYFVVLGLVIVVSIPLALIGVGIVLAFLATVGMVAAGVLDIVFIIVAAVRAGEGRVYDYPLTIRFVPDPKPRRSRKR